MKVNKQLITDTHYIVIKKFQWLILMSKTELIIRKNQETNIPPPP